MAGLNEWKNIDVIYLLCEILDRKLKREKGTSEKLIRFIKDRPGHDRRYAIDSTKIQNELNWKPKYDFKKGLEQTVDWYLNNAEWLNHIITGEYVKYYQNQYSKKL